MIRKITGETKAPRTRVLVLSCRPRYAAAMTQAKKERASWMPTAGLGPAVIQRETKERVWMTRAASISHVAIRAVWTLLTQSEIP